MTIELKPIPDEDVEAYYAMLADESLSINTGSIPFVIDLEWAQDRLITRRREEEDGTRLDRGLYEGSVLVGTAGWFRNKDGDMEIGYAIHKDHRGKGLATFAAAMVLDLLRDARFEGPVYAQYFKDNPASGRVLEKLGFKPDRAIDSISAARIDSAPAWIVRLDDLNEGQM